MKLHEEKHCNGLQMILGSDEIKCGNDICWCCAREPDFHGPETCGPDPRDQQLTELASCRKKYVNNKKKS